MEIKLDRKDILFQSLTRSTLEYAKEFQVHVDRGEYVATNREMEERFAAWCLSLRGECPR